MSSPVFRENLRDTHFTGFADLLYREIAKIAARQFHIQQFGEIIPFEEAMKKIIAQRAYDLVDHIVKQVTVAYVPGGYIHLLKDMDAWPEQEAFGDVFADLAKIHAKLQQPD